MVQNMISHEAEHLDDHLNSHSRVNILLDRDWYFHLAHGMDAVPNYGFVKAGEALKNPHFQLALPQINTSDDSEIPSQFSSGWCNIDLPHDWAVDLPYHPEGDTQYGSKDMNIGRTQKNAIGWYLKYFSIPAYTEDRQVFIEFEGIFRDSIIWMNGHYMGRHVSGYTSFYFDITDYIRHNNQNTIVVKVNASQHEGWWYEGAGIYRHVWLTITSRVHFSLEGGIHIIADPEKGVTISSMIINQSPQDVCIRLTHQVLDPQSHPVVDMETETIVVTGGEERSITCKINIFHPWLWSVDEPNLYRLITEIKQIPSVGDDGGTIDHVENEFGFRNFHFDPEKGFSLNGKAVKIKGVCCHQDHAGVGIALPDGLQWYRIAKLKNMGCNAIRTSHNPPTKALISACDHLGMLLMDELRVFGSSQEALTQLKNIVLRDRNHACVFLWSIGNEEHGVQNTITGQTIANTMLRIIRKLDPTRKITYAGNNGNVYEGVNEVVDVRGWNYINIRQNINYIDEYHNLHPQQPIIGSEEASSLNTRGVYMNSAEKCHLSAYDRNIPPWGSAPEEWWNFYDEREYLCGGFVWTGFDYRGETFPFKWPCISSHFGIMDLCGFPKDSYYYYQAWWTEGIVLHLFPHWNWDVEENTPIEVRCYTNCDEVALFLNGKPLGSVKIAKNCYATWQVNYIPGCLEAKGYRNGNKIIQTQICTSQRTQKILLQAEKTCQAEPDGRTTYIVHATALDTDGKIVHTADNRLHFRVSGHGRILGVGNGDPTCHEPDRLMDSALRKPLENWRYITIKHHVKKEEFLNSLQLPFDDKSYDSNKWIRKDTLYEAAGQKQNNFLLGPVQSTRKHTFFKQKLMVWNHPVRNMVHNITIYRTTLFYTSQDKKEGWNHLILKALAGDIILFINGNLTAQGRSSIFHQKLDISEHIRVGENMIVIVLADLDQNNGILEEVYLGKIIIPSWERSLFNGKCSIIVQTEAESDKNILWARGDGLKLTHIRL